MAQPDSCPVLPWSSWILHTIYRCIECTRCTKLWTLRHPPILHTPTETMPVPVRLFSPENRRVNYSRARKVQFAGRSEVCEDMHFCAFRTSCEWDFSRRQKNFFADTQLGWWFDDNLIFPFCCIDRHIQLVLVVQSTARACKKNIIDLRWFVVLSHMRVNRRSTLRTTSLCRSNQITRVLN